MHIAILGTGHMAEPSKPASLPVTTSHSGLGIRVDPSLLSAPTNVFLSGDDQTAKATVSRLLVDLGWKSDRQIDLGGIATARAAHPDLQHRRHPLTPRPQETRS